MFVKEYSPTQKRNNDSTTGSFCSIFEMNGAEALSLGALIY